MGLSPSPPPDDEDRSRFPAGVPRGGERRPVTESEVLGIVVPDDLRGLEEEIRAVQSELGIDPGPEDLPPRRRRARVWAWLAGRVPSSPTPAGLGRSLMVGPILAITLLVVAGLVALLPSTAPISPRRAPALTRLATPTQAPGTVGGLLPDVGLEAAIGTVPARNLRPAVLMLVPDGCDCPALVHQVIGQVEEFPGIIPALIGSGDPGVARLAVEREGGNGRLPALTDRGSALARAYHGGPPGSVPTLLFVAPDGTLTSPPLAFTDGTRIEAALLPLGQLRT